MGILVNTSYVALGLCPRDNIKPLCNITGVYQLPMYQLLHTLAAIDTVGLGVLVLQAVQYQ